MENIEKRRERQRRYYYRHHEKKKAEARERERDRYHNDAEYRERKTHPIKNPYAFVKAHARRNFGWFAQYYTNDYEQIIHEAIALARSLGCITIKKRLVSVANSCFYRNICELGYAKVNGRFIKRP